MFTRSGSPPSFSLPRWPSYRQVRRFCRTVVRASGVEPPLDLEALCTAVGGLRGRDIRVEYRPTPPGLYGFSISSRNQPVDFIYAAVNTTRLHQEHIVLHELGHLLAGHLDDLASTSEAYVLAGDVAQEREWVAESIATVLAERALLYTRRFCPRPVDPSTRVLDEALRSGSAWV